MRYHFKGHDNQKANYGKYYICDHPVYNSCTLFVIGDKGLAVVQQRFDPEDKATFWSAIDQSLNDILYLNPNFEKFFNERAGKCQNGLYPTVTIRQIMWALRLKPLPKERWETAFDRKEI